MAKRRLQSAPFRDPKTGRWKLSALPATPTSYLGGLTFPGVTSRPHMGPFNRVNPVKISDADEVYRQHDIGYSNLLKRGRNPYFTWNKYDQELMNAPSVGWPDYLAKSLFAAKRVFTYGLPTVKGTNMKPVESVTDVPVSYKDYKTSTIDSGFVDQLTSNSYTKGEGAQAYAWANRGGMSTSIPSGSSGGGKFHSRVWYTKK